MRFWDTTLEWEEHYLSPFAMRTAASKGRIHPEEECEIRTPFQRDRDRIIHSKAFRRLKSKTQVFIAPQGDHYRTRLTHVLEVAQISRTVARALRLNEDLTEAIALGHDLGHTPFGHAGESALRRLLGSFHHNEQSLRVVDVLENHSSQYRGLNLTAEVRDGILNHTGRQLPCTLEGRVVRLCDRIAYLNHDVEDAVRGGILQESDLPKDVIAILGNTRSERIDVMVKDVIHSSAGKNAIVMSADVDYATNLLRRFLFEHVYIDSIAKQEEAKVYRILSLFFQYYMNNKEELEERVGYEIDDLSLKREVADYIAGMSDRFAIREFQRLFLPSGWNG